MMNVSACIIYNKYIIYNTTWKVLCTVFTHSLFLYQKSYSFAALTRSISDTSTTRAQIPYASTFHEVLSMYNIQAISKNLAISFFAIPYWLQVMKLQ